MAVAGGRTIPGKIDLDSTNVPVAPKSLQKCVGNYQMAIGSRVNAVCAGDVVARPEFCLRLSHYLTKELVYVSVCYPLFRGDVPSDAREATQRSGVVFFRADPTQPPAAKRITVDGTGRTNDDKAHPAALEPLNDLGHGPPIADLTPWVDRRVSAVVHAVARCRYGGAESHDVRLHAKEEFQRSLAAQAKLVRADITHRLASKEVGFDERGIEALFSDGIATDCDDVASPKA